MKKYILFTLLSMTILGLTSFSYLVKENHSNKTYSNFFYDVGSRFESIDKSTLISAKSVNDIISNDQIKSVVSYTSLSIIVIKNDIQSDIQEHGRSNAFNASQLNLLNSLSYSSNFLIRIEYLEQNEETGELQQSYITPHLTIVPEKQAEYIPGKESFLEFIKEKNTRHTANLDEDKLQPAKLYFVVTKKGTIEGVRLDRSSGYSPIDESMIKLINKMPGKWQPAENSKGEKVDQELVISFGMVGC